MGIRDKPVAPASPWQNGFAERLIGSIRRECLDHIIVLSEMHLRQILRSYARYYNDIRTHRSLNKDAPVARPVQRTGASNRSPSSADSITTTSGFRFSVPTGGELEATLRIARGFELLGGIGVTHAELVNVPLGGATGAKDGGRVPNVPPLTANIGFQYQVSAASLRLAGDFFVWGNYQFVGIRAADVANSFDLPSYGVVNGKLGWKAQSFDAYVFANNLLDERYEVFGQSFGPTAQSVRVGQGRLVGIGATARF
ncbi:TonB-dependent receptor domain-containing protein [Bradyrhizobium cenepequi]|uniref:TonB-dependent receptor domain-containing protein n=1 Tax=Bradyrhizobium cenepequi TaxID=2821403 RepID=UPI001CE2C0D0